MWVLMEFGIKMLRNKKFQNQLRRKTVGKKKATLGIIIIKESWLEMLGKETTG